MQGWSILAKFLQQARAAAASVTCYYPTIIRAIDLYLLLIFNLTKCFGHPESGQSR